METEQQLLQQLHSGQPRAQHELYCRYAAMAMAVAMRYVADSDVARDVLQESFVKVLTRIGSFQYRGEGSLKSWVMRIVSNEAIDWLRQQSKWSFAEGVPDDIPDADETDVGPLPPEVLQQLIKRLPSGYRAVLNLYVFEQQSHKEIARLLGISESTSASQFLRAKKLLARMIHNYINNPRI